MKKSILLVGAMQSGIAYIALLLENEGYQAIKCSGLNEIVYPLKVRPFALAIVDMPARETAVPDLFATLRQEPPLADIPIILLWSGHQNGPDAFSTNGHQNIVVKKPILPYLLLQAVANSLSHISEAGD